ncbi:pilin [Pseudomonas sp. NPDC077382]
MKKQQSGFTMIELIMVIVILGILAAFALPRFADFSGDARLSAMQGAAGSVKSASAIVHAAALADPIAAAAGEVTVEVAIDLVDKYAAPTEAGIGLAAQLSADDFDIDDSTTAGTIVIADQTKAACSFSYTMVTGDTAPKISTTALTAGNCD